MNSVLAVILSALSAYLIGSFPTSFILTKILTGVDIRQVGSKNAGATNVLRTAGKIPALVTLIVDVLKGVIVVTVVANFFYSFNIEIDFGLYRAILGLIVVCGHIWSVFLNFRGGKGIATTLGVGIVIAPKVLLLSFAIWLIAFFMTKYVSLASISALVTFPIIAGISLQPFYIIALGLILCAIGVYKHKDNIKRLLKGQEHKTIIFKPRL